MSQAAARVTLSVVIIARNAEDALPATLDSIRGLADEIVVVDTGSTDSTRQIVEQRGVAPREFAWDRDFSAAKNFALSQARGAWVLWLDAGETVAPSVAQGIRQIVDGKALPNTAYALFIRVPPLSGVVAGEQIAQVRLVPRVSGVAFQGRVRESLAESLEKVGLRVETLPLPIQRGAREHDPQIKVRRARRNVELARLELDEAGPRARLLNCLADAYQTLDDPSLAEQFYRQALAASVPGSPEMLEAYYGLLTTQPARDSSQPDLGSDRIALCLQALEMFPLDAQLLCAMGGYLHAEDRLDLAERSYEVAHQHGQVEPRAWHVEDVHEVAASCFCLALQLRGQLDQAEETLQQALLAHGDSLRLRRQLLDLLIKRGRRDDALRQLNALGKRVGNVAAMRSVVRGACLAAEKNWTPAKSYLETGYNAGCRDPLCLRWLSQTLLAMGKTEQAQSIAREWQQLEVDSLEARKFLAALGDFGTRAKDDRRLRVDHREQISPRVDPQTIPAERR